jgi:murein DD-endopeptidase MepM/ murein hydrolase activator NlpD
LSTSGNQPSQATTFNGSWLKGGAKIIGTPYHGTHTVGNWQSDNALDISVPVGTPVYAPVSGKLGNTGLLNGQGASGGGRFSGERINLFGRGNGFYFAHLSKLAPGIAKGATVKKGQLLGYTGEANGVAHLHFGVENGNPSTYYGSQKPRR